MLSSVTCESLCYRGYELHSIYKVKKHNVNIDNNFIIQNIVMKCPTCISTCYYLTRTITFSIHLKKTTKNIFTKNKITHISRQLCLIFHQKKRLIAHCGIRKRVIHSQESSTLLSTSTTFLSVTLVM